MGLALVGAARLGYSGHVSASPGTVRDQTETCQDEAATASSWPPAGTSTWPHAKTFSWPRHWWRRPWWWVVRPAEAKGRRDTAVQGLPASGRPRRREWKVRADAHRCWWAIRQRWLENQPAAAGAEGVAPVIEAPGSPAARGTPNRQGRARPGDARRQPRVTGGVTECPGRRATDGHAASLRMLEIPAQGTFRDQTETCQDEAATAFNPKVLGSRPRRPTGEMGSGSSGTLFQCPHPYLW